MQKLPNVSVNKLIKNLPGKEKKNLFFFMVIKKSVDLNYIIKF